MTPRWFAGAGGWTTDDAVDRFARYATRATEHLGDLFSWVATLNEPNVIDLLDDRRDPDGRGRATGRSTA